MRRRLGAIIYWTVGLAFVVLLMIRLPDAIAECEAKGGLFLKGYCHT